MKTDDIDILELHWLMDMIQSIDVGMVVIDKDYTVQVWNSFMANHSGKHGAEVIDFSLFATFPDLPKNWLKRKVESVFLIKNRAFTTWEQHPYLFRFKNYRPITGTADFMYQNVTFVPLVSASGEINHVCIIVYDVTDYVVHKFDLLDANQKLEQLSQTDFLTQLNNRGHWEELLELEFRRNQRTKQPCSLVMFDIDHFKKVNDTYGHQAGDEVIRVTSQLLRDMLRNTDIAGRYGGEEFVIILIDTDAEGAKIVAERLRKNIEACTVTHEDVDIRFTVSLGIAELTDQQSDHKQWIENSDKALYVAKEGGRNCSKIYDSSAVK